MPITQQAAQNLPSSVSESAPEADVPWRRPRVRCQIRTVSEMMRELLLGNAMPLAERQLSSDCYTFRGSLSKSEIDSLVTNPSVRVELR